MARKPNKDAEPKPPSMKDDMKGLQDMLSRAPSPARVDMFIRTLVERWKANLSADQADERIASLREAMDEGVEAAHEARNEVDTNSKSETRAANAAVEAIVAAQTASRAA